MGLCVGGAIMTENAPRTRARPAVIRPQTCPVCGKELAPEAGSASKLFPFCSPRCRQIDFIRWCDGRYAIVDPLTQEHLQAEQEQQAGPEADLDAE